MGKICPLLSMTSYLLKPQDWNKQVLKCRKDECAWWIESKKNCTIPELTGVKEKQANSGGQS